MRFNYIILILITLLIFFSCQKEVESIDKPKNKIEKKGDTAVISEKSRIKKCSGAGQWFPAGKEELKSSIETYLSKYKDVKHDKNIFAIISPHAGYQYSGQCAAAGFAYIKNQKIDKVIILGLSHHVYVEGASIYNADFHETPLGLTRVCRKDIDYLLNRSFFKEGGNYHLIEHSLENQVPFIQYCIKGAFEIVPVMIGSLTKESLDSIAKSISSIITPKTLIVASSDFTHYGPRFGYTPFKDNIKENIRKLDNEAAQSILTLKQDIFADFLNKTRCTICGRNPIRVLLKIIENPKYSLKGEIAEHYSSGDITGDYSNPVSYFSIIFYKTEKEVKKMELTEKEKDFLLKLARDTIKHHIIEKTETAVDESELTDNLKKKCGAFVTLNENGQLRGCIGYILPKEPLYKTVIENAVNSSTRDYRFPPVTADEIGKIKIEISVLTPPVKVDSYKDIVIGKHGVILRKGFRSAVFLPQVAPEQGWDIETTLHYLSLKAGLGPDDWKENAEFEVFEAIVFKE